MLAEKNWQIAGRNILIYKHAKEIISAFARDNIPLMVLKGLALAETLYPHIGMRMMADMDFLIKEQDLDRVHRKLNALGYRLKSKESSFSYTKQNGICIAIDLHTNIPYLNKTEEAWETAREIKIAEIPAQTLSLEHTLIFLCCHMAVYHGYLHEKWLEDIHRFITRHKKEIDWQGLTEKIQQYRLGSPCYYLFMQAKEVFKTAIPENILILLKPKPLLNAKICKLIFMDKKRIPFADYLIAILVYPFPRLIMFIFPPVKILKLRYSTDKPWVYLWYMLRPFVLIVNGIKGIIGVGLRFVKSA